MAEHEQPGAAAEGEGMIFTFSTSFNMDGDLNLTSSPSLRLPSPSPSNTDSPSSEENLPELRQRATSTSTPIPIMATGQMEPEVAAFTAEPVAPHQDKDAIIRQVEHYFSEENLPGDAHLLALTGGDGNGYISIGEILSWKTMRGFKPPSAVKAALKLSSQLEISEDNKRIKRRYPLQTPLRVLPQVSPSRKTKVEADQPWLSKNMLAPTGFERNAVEGPIAPAVYAEERELYHPDISFTSRIEEAVNRFPRNKKLHQTVRHYFTSFLKFGGIIDSGHQFSGGLTKKALKKEGVDQHEIDRLTALFSLSHAVLDEFDEANPNDGLWVVDFPGVAKAYLSSYFPSTFSPYDDGDIALVCNVLRTFYNYLLYHEVCPEYDDDLKAARLICDEAEHELVQMGLMERLLPGKFSLACSVLFGGAMAGVYRSPDAEWHTLEDTSNMGMPVGLAIVQFMAGIHAFGTQDQAMSATLSKYKPGAPHPFDYKVMKHEEDVGLRVLKLVPVPKPAMDYFYVAEHMHMMICERWEVPFAKRKDLPPSVFKDKKQEDLAFAVPAELAEVFMSGAHLVVDIKTLDIGISWIDRVVSIHPTFFTWLPNEFIHDYKKPGPPTECMKKKGENNQGKMQDAEDVTQEKQTEEIDGLAGNGNGVKIV